LRKVLEGGCGVVGIACSVKTRGRHLLVPCVQMHNRGNGKGGGVIALGLSAEQMMVPETVLKSHYLLQIAYLKPGVRKKVEREFIHPKFDVHTSYPVETLADYRETGLEVKPPDVHRYFCRVKKNVLKKFMRDSGIKNKREAEDEFVFQNSNRLNKKYYEALGDKLAFVLCHSKDMLVFKIVGYAEQAINYYGLEDVRAHIWVGHQRYPTKGVVWHPGGAHPFIGLNEALVHNGDFANYHSVVEYLRQNGREPLFLTDTEVSVLLFDLWRRRFKYPLEYVIEALAPTTERDFLMLPPEKQEVYAAIQKTHIQCSPDGPWFFIIARNDGSEGGLKLIGITDTSMLRPQVFALQENGGVKIGLIASEKQAIDAALKSISSDDPRFLPVADVYWNARGGSHTDGGAFIFTAGPGKLECCDKFGREMLSDSGIPYRGDAPVKTPFKADFTAASKAVAGMSYGEVRGMLANAVEHACAGDRERREVVSTLTQLIDRRCRTGGKKRSCLLALFHDALYEILRKIPASSKHYQLVSTPRDKIPPPPLHTSILAVDASKFTPEGVNGVARMIVKGYEKGWRHFIIFDMNGQRFVGCGIGPHNDKVYIDVYGSSGDYAGSGMMNTELTIHGNGQDQLGQIMKSGKLVVYGDVGQTFLYGAKGGVCFVLGNAAGRPMINAVGRIKAVINGTCLDYLAESFMAGDPLGGGGFAIVNGVRFDDDGNLRELETVYPGGNLFSLSSGGAIYVRDPHMKLDDNQLNGGKYVPLTPDDWLLIEPYLKENEELFGIKLDDLLTVDGKLRYPEEVYRKVTVADEVLG
jgi:glutamate synthase domain-containing protein 1/glutamate synthase domain-containing protein 3